MFDISTFEFEFPLTGFALLKTVFPMLFHLCFIHKLYLKCYSNLTDH